MDAVWQFMPHEINVYLVTPLLIMLARICDVTIGTIRIIFVSRGMRVISSICGFFEVLIWIVVISRMITGLGGWPSYVGYAAGFSLGNYIGITIENKLAMGMVALRIITNRSADELIAHLKLDYHGATSIAARSATGEVRLVWAVIKRKDVEYYLDLIMQHNPNAYISIEDVRMLSSTYYPPKTTNGAFFSRRFRFSLKKK